MHDLHHLIVWFTKTKLRMVTGFGVAWAVLSVAAACVYLFGKLVAWQVLNVAGAPMGIFLCFLAAVQIASLGVIGEYFIALQADHHPALAKHRKKY